MSGFVTRTLGRARVGLDLGSLVHVLVGAAVGWLNPLLAIAATECYVLYQYIDYLTGESAEEVRGDIVEYAAGLMLGLALGRLFPV